VKNNFSAKFKEQNSKLQFKVKSACSLFVVLGSAADPGSKLRTYVVLSKEKLQE
jgi:hypothetical protein